MHYNTSIIDECVKQLEWKNKPDNQFGTRIVNRSEVIMLPAAWSTHARCSIRANNGHWEGNRFISDTTGTIGVFVYGNRRIDVEPQARTVQLMARYEWWGSTEARVLREAGLGVYSQYILATHVDPGMWGVRCANGWYGISPFTLLRDTKDGLVCDREDLRIRKTDISSESTRYMRQVAKHLRDLFRNMDMFRRGSSPDVGPYGIEAMKEMFNALPRGREATIVRWWNAGAEFDDYIYRCFLSQASYAWHYKYHAFNAEAETFFQNNIRRMANTIRRAKYSTPL